MIKILLLAVVPFMTQHRNVVPKTEVSTNFYGSVTGIVDKAYIEARVGASGGGCDTNAVDALANSAVVTNALTVATTNRVTSLESSKADRPELPVTAGNLAALTADGNLADSGKTVGDFLPRVSNEPVRSTFDINGPLLLDMDGYIQLNTAGFIYGPFDNIQEEMGSKISLRTELDSKADRSMISATNTTFSSAVNAIVDTKADKATTLAGYGITDAVPFVDDVNGTKTAVTIGSLGGKIGENSLANGDGVVASGNYSHAEGSATTADGNFSHAEGSVTTAAGDYSHAEGCNTTAAGEFSHAEGFYAYTKEQDTFAFAWNGDVTRETEYDPYYSHGEGTFNINPVGGLNGFWIGEQSLYEILTNKADKADIYTKSEFDAEINEKISGKQDLLNPGSDIHVNSIETDSASNFGNIIIKNNNGLAFSGVELSPNGPLERIGVLGFGGKTAFEQVNNLIGNSISATNPAFSSAVLAVGLNIDTNSVAVLNEIAATFGGFPLGAGETATTVGGLLAALAAAAAWLKKNKVGSFASVGGASATVDNGVAKLSDFFTESNSLLTATIDARLPYPLNAVPSTGVLKDRAINTTSLATVTVPDNFTDLLIRATVASSLSVTMPAGTTKYGDTFPGEAGEYLITITKTGAAEAYVRTIKLEEVA